MKITVIDYGLSNLLSVQRAFEHFGAECIVTESRSKIMAANALCLPGVGAFKDGMEGLERLMLTDAIKAKAAAGTPLLGICLGMQMLFDESGEFGSHAGLGLIPGRVERIPQTDINGGAQRVPHVGWNILLPQAPNTDFSGTILAGIRQGEEAYFVHSYEAKPTDAKYRLANTIYGGREVCAAAQNNNVIGCQFHPEKSGEVGLAIIKEYIRLCENI